MKASERNMINDEKDHPIELAKRARKLFGVINNRSEAEWKRKFTNTCLRKGPQQSIFIKEK